jgi:hypothetical protein
MPRRWAFLRVIFLAHHDPMKKENPMRNWIISGVKTAVQVGVAAFVGWLTQRGINVTGEAAVALETGVFMVATGIVASLLNIAGERWPIVNRVVSLGISNQTAEYTGSGG